MTQRISRHAFYVLAFSLWTLVALLPVGAQETATSAGARPNILMVIGDDMTWNDCEPYGNLDVRTPHMARLAREGLCLDAMFTAAGMCSPLRQQLYSGMFPVRNGAWPNHSRVYDGVKSVGHHLAALGYRVGLIGKRHFGPASSFPFDQLGRNGKNKGSTDAEAIREYVGRDKSQPYCLFVTSKEPHGAWTKGRAEDYDPGSFTVPPHMVDCPETRRDMARYYAEITVLDEQLGACMDIVDQSSQRDNTIVMFASEQGASFPAAGKWTCYDTGLKAAFIVRWPARVKPGTRNRALCQYVDVMPTLVEVAGGDPTKVDTGRPDAHGHTGFDGRSLLKVLRGETGQHHDYVYGIHTTRGIIRGSASYPIRSVRSERYKLIRNLSHENVFYNAESTKPDGLLATWRKLGQTDPWAAAKARRYQFRPAVELYDVQTDPFELTNLADDPAYAAIRLELGKRLDLWMEQQGDQGVATEMQALVRQGRKPGSWKPYDPNKPVEKRQRKNRNRRRK